MCEAWSVNICVYCGSSSGSDPVYADEARRLGRSMAGRDIGLVYGGGRVGLMGLVADSILDAGGRAVGIIPEQLVRAEAAHGGLTLIEVVGSMHERKARMEQLSDGFIVLPGGFGTFDEAFEILTWNQLGLIAKPIVFLDGTGYYTPLFDAFDRMVAAGFVSESYRPLMRRATTVDEAVTMASSPAPFVDGKLRDLDVTSKRGTL